MKTARLVCNTLGLASFCVIIAPFVPDMSFLYPFDSIGISAFCFMLAATPYLVLHLLISFARTDTARWPVATALAGLSVLLLNIFYMRHVTSDSACSSVMPLMQLLMMGTPVAVTVFSMGLFASWLVAHIRDSGGRR